ncbi:NADP-dependent phosphogluconate dehydrogenase [Candidatus Kaiserbacteria bacterium]|nr:NADP-dependent phosphogluconate dehydrogenase [Candidatus Kaiserbacteria bacterium]
MKKELGVVGLGKMGAGIVEQLLEQGWAVHGHKRHKAEAQRLIAKGMRFADSPAELIGALPGSRIVWLMVPAYVKDAKGKIVSKPVDELLFGNPLRQSADGGGIAAMLSKGDVVIDGGNSFYKDSMRRSKLLSKRGVKFIDVGFSGGPYGARHGGCLMIGGDEKTFRQLEPLFKALAQPGGYQFFKGAGAGHFVKMVHNGIEYGMMQSIAEGFAVMKKSKYKLDLSRVADIYQHGSVIESRLVGWLKKGFAQHTEELKGVSGAVGHTGEGEWTAAAARELKVSAKIIEESFKFRVRSAENPSYTGKVVSALREQFGGHSVTPEKEKK